MSGSSSGDGTLSKKTFVSAPHEKGVLVGESLQDAEEKGSSPLSFGSTVPKATLADEASKAGKDAKESKDKSDDAWDIPAFLRRRKK